ncbi:hypothetical protein ACQP2X_05985 [Actinoplanes sp. CA-131856]
MLAVAPQLELDDEDDDVEAEADADAEADVDVETVALVDKPESAAWTTLAPTTAM